MQEQAVGRRGNLGLSDLPFHYAIVPNLFSHSISIIVTFAVLHYFAKNNFADKLQILVF